MSFSQLTHRYDAVRGHRTGSNVTLLNVRGKFGIRSLGVAWESPARRDIPWYLVVLQQKWSNGYRIIRTIRAFLLALQRILCAPGCANLKCTSYVRSLQQYTMKRTINNTTRYYTRLPFGTCLWEWRKNELKNIERAILYRTHIVSYHDVMKYLCFVVPEAASTYHTAADPHSSTERPAGLQIAVSDNKSRLKNT